ncbi:MAG: hypothetical protein ABIM30_01055 [candidate division WOR-3 bacterium]
MLDKSTILKHTNYIKAKKFLKKYGWRLIISSKKHEDAVGEINLDDKIICIYYKHLLDIKDFDATLVHELAHFFLRNKFKKTNITMRHIKWFEEQSLNMWDKVVLKLNLEVDLIALAISRKIDFKSSVLMVPLTTKEMKGIYDKEKRKAVRRVLSEKIKRIGKKGTRIRTLYTRIRKVSQERC